MHPIDMAASSNAAYPVRTLREMVTALEAAITLTVAEAKPKSVHKLRTTTRRLEAQLELLALVPNLPDHGKPATKAKKLLKGLRRQAGRVRDLDVQRKLTKGQPPRLEKEARHLRKMFKRQRKDEADDLLGALEKYQPKLTRALERLLDALGPAEDLTVPAPQLIQITLRWYRHNIPVTAPQDADQLHAVRKSAKLARYMAESASPAQESAKSNAIARLARTFESLQQSGGDWHDWLTLSQIAGREFGSSSQLTRSFTGQCEKSLAAYQRRLKSLSRTLATIAPDTTASARPPA
jgi:CHAD domain-containing protein